MFRIIHEILFYGKGGYDYDTVYNMPVWLRNATYNFISESLAKENEANKNTGKSSNRTALDWINPDKSKLK